MTQKELERKQKQLDRFYKILHKELTPVQMKVVNSMVELALEIEEECNK